MTTKVVKVLKSQPCYKRSDFHQVMRCFWVDAPYFLRRKRNIENVEK